MSLLANSEINSRVAKDLLPEVLFESLEPRSAAEERGLMQMSSEDDLVPVVDGIINEHTEVVNDYKAGKETALKFLLGQGMKATKGSANPQTLEKLLKERIG